MKRFLYLSIHRLYLIWILCKIYAEKVQQELFWVHFLGYPYHSNSTKIHLDAALMMYVSLDLECNRQNFLSFWTIFCTFTPLTTKKFKILKNWKKHLEISSFYISIPKIMIRWCTVPEIWYVTDVIVISHFGPLFALLPT